APAGNCPAGSISRSPVYVFRHIPSHAFSHLPLVPPRPNVYQLLSLWDCRVAVWGNREMSLRRNMLRGRVNRSGLIALCTAATLCTLSSATAFGQGSTPATIRGNIQASSGGGAGRAHG